MTRPKTRIAALALALVSAGALAACTPAPEACEPGVKDLGQIDRAVPSGQC